MTNRQNRCFFSSIIKALGIKKKFKLYTTEKENARAGIFSDNNQNSLGTKSSESCNAMLDTSGRRGSGFFNKFRVEDSMENFILKSLLGFLGGIFLTYICFMFLVFSLNFTLKRATYICMGLGVILSLGLAFSVKIRCTVFLCIPQLFSKRGRQALLAYAFILALSGPAKNTLHNVEVMSESLACTQEQLKQAENELLKCVQKPNAAAKKSIEKLLEKINSAVKHFKNFLLQLYKNCIDILETVLHAKKWLYSISFLCHKKIGKPTHSCLSLLAETSDNCQSIIPEFAWKQLCQISPRDKNAICYTEAKTVCPNPKLRRTLPIWKLQAQLEEFKRRTKSILYVKIETQQTYSQANRSHTYHEEYQGMATEIRQKTDQFLQYFDFMSVIFGIFILVLFVKVVIYRHKFLTEDHYDNRYITSDFVDIDKTRAAFHMKTILPLEPKEKMQYIKVTSVRLVPCERVRLFSSFIFLIFATFKIIIHMLTDSSLYWILSTIRRDERLLYMTTITEERPSVGILVNGEGLVASLFQNVTRVVKAESSFFRMDPTPCLPDPVPPDWNRYYQILALVLICWLLALWEPYGLRLRHSVMVTYHPDRARERAIWLYNRIISNRVNFVKMSRRVLRRKYRDVSLKDTLRYKLLGSSAPKCLLCEAAVNGFTSVKCKTRNCVGIYCESCFVTLKFCSICRDPADYDDLSDVSEEKDSSEEDCPFIYEVDSPVQECGNDGGSVNTGTLSETSEIYSPVSFSHWGSRDPTFGKIKSVMDCESSDWEHESLIRAELYSLDERGGMIEKCEPESSESAAKSVRRSSSECSSQERSVTKCSDVEEEGDLLEDDLDRFPDSTENASRLDFNFRQSARTPRTRSGLSRIRDSFALRLISPIPSSESNRGSDMQVFARTVSDRVESPREDVPPFPSPRESDSNSERRRSRKLPFIDPINLHQFFAKPHGETRKKEPSEKGGRGKRKKRKDKFQEELGVEERDRAGLRQRGSSDVDSIKFFYGEDATGLSCGCDTQFYAEPYRLTDLNSIRSKTGSDMKRPAGGGHPDRMPNAPAECQSFDSSEAGSSLERFSTAEMSRDRTLRPKPSPIDELDEESDREDVVEEEEKTGQRDFDRELVRRSEERFADASKGRTLRSRPSPIEELDEESECEDVAEEEEASGKTVLDCELVRCPNDSLADVPKGRRPHARPSPIYELVEESECEHAAEEEEEQGSGKPVLECELVRCPNDSFADVPRDRRPHARPSPIYELDEESECEDRLVEEESSRKYVLDCELVCSEESSDSSEEGEGDC